MSSAGKSPRAKAHQTKISRKNKRKDKSYLGPETHDVSFSGYDSVSSSEILFSHTDFSNGNGNQLNDSSTWSQNNGKNNEDIELLKIQLQETLQENSNIKMRLHVEIKDRLLVETKNQHLSEKLVHAGKILQETGNTLFKLQKATDQLMQKRDQRELKLQKTLEVNKRLEERVEELHNRLFEMGDSAKLEQRLQRSLKLNDEKDEAVLNMEIQLKQALESLSIAKREAQVAKEEKSDLDILLQAKQKRIEILESALQSLNTDIATRISDQENLDAEIKTKNQFKAMEEKFSSYEMDRSHLIIRVAQLEKQMKENGIRPISVNMDTPRLNMINEVNSVKLDPVVVVNDTFDPLFALSSVLIIDTSTSDPKFVMQPKTEPSVPVEEDRSQSAEANSFVRYEVSAVLHAAAAAAASIEEEANQDTRMNSQEGGKRDRSTGGEDATDTKASVSFSNLNQLMPAEDSKPWEAPVPTSMFQRVKSRNAIANDNTNTTTSQSEDSEANALRARSKSNESNKASSMFANRGSSAGTSRRILESPGSGFRPRSRPNVETVESSNAQMDSNKDDGLGSTNASPSIQGIQMQLKQRDILLNDRKVLKRQIFNWQKNFSTENGGKEPTKDDIDNETKEMYIKYKKVTKALKDLEISLGITPSDEKTPSVSQTQHKVSEESVHTVRSVRVSSMDETSSSRPISGRNDESGLGATN